MTQMAPAASDAKGANRFIAPFDAVAATYDKRFSFSEVGRAQRASVWIEMDRAFSRSQRILEINCGTGVDAMRLANRGIEVLACDASPAMIQAAQRRLASNRTPAAVEFKCLPTEELSQLEADKPFDGALSNFAGLNCVHDLTGVAVNLARLLRPGANAVLCLFGRFCLWEIASYAFRLDFAKAFRRVSPVVEAAIAPGATVKVHYWTVRSVRDAFAPHFRLRRCKGVGVIVPPTHLEALAVAFRRTFRMAAAMDPWLGRCPVVRTFADHVVLTFERMP